MARLASLLFLAVACGFSVIASGCATEPQKDTLLDREFEAYRGDREERRLDDLKERYAKAKAEADRLEAETARLEAQIAARKIRVSEATAAALRLPEPARVGGPAAPPGVPPDARRATPAPGAAK